MQKAPRDGISPFLTCILLKVNEPQHHFSSGILHKRHSYDGHGGHDAVLNSPVRVYQVYFSWPLTKWIWLIRWAVWISRVTWHDPKAVPSILQTSGKCQFFFCCCLFDHLPVRILTSNLRSSAIKFTKKKTFEISTIREYGFGEHFPFEQWENKLNGDG